MDDVYYEKYQKYKMKYLNLIQSAGWGEPSIDIKYEIGGRNVDFSVTYSITPNKWEFMLNININRGAYFHVPFYIMEVNDRDERNYFRKNSKAYSVGISYTRDKCGVPQKGTPDEIKKLRRLILLTLIQQLLDNRTKFQIKINENENFDCLNFIISMLIQHSEFKNNDCQIPLISYVRVENNNFVLHDDHLKVIMINYDILINYYKATNVIIKNFNDEKNIQDYYPIIDKINISDATKKSIKTEMEKVIPEPPKSESKPEPKPELKLESKPISKLETKTDFKCPTSGMRTREIRKTRMGLSDEEERLKYDKFIETCEPQVKFKCPDREMPFLNKYIRQTRAKISDESDKLEYDKFITTCPL
jgi:predicted RNA-binding Zn-ribbon protein involved in translation (DUF1610 family)